MCLAIPMQVIKRDNASPLGTVGQGGVTYEVNFSLFPEAQTGDYVLVHAGFVIQRLDAEEAGKTLALFDEMLRGEAAHDG